MGMNRLFQGNVLYSVAFLMSALVIMLPICMSSAMAQIHDARTYGSAGVEGYMTPNDDITVRARVSIPGEQNLTASQVRLGSFNFASCGNPDPNSVFLCELTIPTQGFNLEGSQAYPVNLYDQYGSLIATRQTSIRIDDAPPLLAPIHAPESVGRGEFEVFYSVTDYPIGFCSGIGGIRMYKDGVASPIYQEVLNQTSCTKSGSISLNGTQLGNGVSSLRLVAYDRLGQESAPQSKAINVILDSVSASGIAVYDSEGRAARWFNVPDQYTIKANFSGPSLSGSVLADFSNINPGYTMNRSASSCSSYSGITECEWHGIDVSITAQRTASILFNMEDFVGNTHSTTGTVTLNYDSTGPSINSIGTSRRYGGIYYAKEKGNIFTTEISENAGLREEDVRLYVGNISLGDQSHMINPTSCINTSSSIYQCNFTGIDISDLRGEVYQAYFLNDTKDIHGNHLASPSSIDFMIDTMDPVIKDVEIRALKSTGEASSDMIEVGDSLVITAVIDEDTIIGEAYANITQLVFGQEHLQGGCAKNTTAGPDSMEWICTWETPTFDVDGYLVANISLSIFDGAGNSDSYHTSLVVYDRSDIVNAVWTGNVTMSAPEYIDRQLVTFYEPSIWKIVKFEVNVPDTRPQSIELIECMNADPNSTIDDSVFISGQPEIFNYNQFVFDPVTGISNNPIDEVYIKFRLIQAAPLNQSSLNINCSFRIVGLMNSTTTVHAPPANVTFQIDYTDNPFDLIEDAVNTEIEAVKNSWLVQASWLDDLNKMLDYANLICSLFDTLIKIITIWNVISDIWNEFTDKGAAAVAAIPAKMAAGTAGEAVKEITSEGWKSYGKKFCAIISCTYAYRDDTNEQGSIMSFVNAITGRGDFVEKMRGSGRDRNSWLGNISYDPKSSLILSLLYMCVPGVIYNLQKARLIDCNYVKCLQQVENGMPIIQCTSMRAYGFCKFVFGEIFNLIPFAQAISNIGQTITQALSDPAMLISFVASAICKFFCIAPRQPSFTCTVCGVLDFTNLMLDLACDLGAGGANCPGVWEMMSVDDSVCTEILRDEE